MEYTKLKEKYNIECDIDDIVYVVDATYFNTIDTKTDFDRKKYGLIFDAFFYAIKKYRVYKIEIGKDQLTDGWINYYAEEVLEPTLEEQYNAGIIYVNKKKIFLYEKGKGNLWTTDLTEAKNMAKKFNYNYEWLNNPAYKEDKDRLKEAMKKFYDEELRDVFL